MTTRNSSLTPRAAQAALVAALDRRIKTEGRISFPAAPALLEHYLRRLSALFASSGKAFSRAELSSLRGFLVERMKAGFEQSPHSRVHVSWQPEEAPGVGVDYKIWLEGGSLEGEYDHWAVPQGPPPFGAHADAKLLAVVRRLSHPQRHRVLDVGAGSGRNALALARAGWAVDALELTPAFCRSLRRAARAERLPIEVVQGSLFAPKLSLGRGRYSVVVCSEVTSHFRGLDDLRTFFERASAWTRSGGSVLANVFLAEPGFEPTPSARELSQIAWSTLFTRAELAKATRGLGLSRISDESVHDFERANQPVDSWPPTSWFESWSRGFNCYRVKSGKSPIELRWLHYRKRAAERGRA